MKTPFQVGDVVVYSAGTVRKYPYLDTFIFEVTHPDVAFPELHVRRGGKVIPRGAHTTESAASLRKVTISKEALTLILHFS